MNEEPTQWVDRKVDEASAVYSRHGTIFRVLWVLVATIIVAAGIAMIVFPGPVTIVVPAGLVMLAVVFGWARRLLLRSVEAGVEAKHRIEDAPRTAKVLGAAAGACVAGAAVAVVALT